MKKVDILIPKRFQTVDAVKGPQCTATTFASICHSFVCHSRTVQHSFFPIFCTSFWPIADTDIFFFPIKLYWQMQTYNVFQHAHIDWCSHCVHKKRHYISSSCRQKCSHLADRNISLSANFRMHPDTIVYWLSWMHHLAFSPLTYLTEWVIKSVKIWFNCFGHGWRVAMTTLLEQGSSRPI